MPSSGKLGRRQGMEKMKHYEASLLNSLLQFLWKYELLHFQLVIECYIWQENKSLQSISAYTLKHEHFKANFPLWFSWTYAKQHMKITICNVL